jgi:rod shape-determining protein MreC
MFGAIKRLFPWLLTTALSISMILLSRDQEIAPLQDQVNDLVAMGGYPISAGVRIFALWSTNRVLRSQLAARTLESSEYKELLRENERLRRMLDYKGHSSLNLIAAEVVGFSSDAGVKGLLINRGSLDGITTNQAVITPDGLVGRVFRVSTNSAAIQLLGDPNLGVAARIIKAQESGIVHAAGTGRLKLEGVPVSATASIGDSVVTTGQGGIFPPGILVGFTTKVYPSMEGWLLTVELKQSVDLRRVEEVFVIRLLSAGE